VTKRTRAPFCANPPTIPAHALIGGKAQNYCLRAVTPAKEAAKKPTHPRIVWSSVREAETRRNDTGHVWAGSIG
jgi:hypothetical protein